MIAAADGGEAEDRRMRVLAIGLMCGAMLCFTGLDTCAKWLSFGLPAVQIVWARYVAAALIALAASRPLSRPAALRSRRPWLQLIRSTLLLGSTMANVLALRQLQLSETATISFLTPIFVALLAGPLLGERVGTERVIAIAVGFLGVAIATRPGTAAFQPIVLVAVAGVLCNSGYVLATRRLAAADPPQTTLAWTQIAGIVILTPLLPWVWRHPATAQVWLIMAAMGAFGACGHAVDRRASIRAGSGPDAVHLHPAPLDDRFRRARFWRLAVGRNLDWRRPGRCLRRVSRASRAARATA
jgi:drug/metabolite transporter (DMT)-like permease